MDSARGHPDLLGLAALPSADLRSCGLGGSQRAGVARGGTTDQLGTELSHKGAGRMRQAAMVGRLRGQVGTFTAVVGVSHVPAFAPSETLRLAEIFAEAPHLVSVDRRQEGRRLGCSCPVLLVVRPSVAHRRKAFHTGLVGTRTLVRSRRSPRGVKGLDFLAEEHVLGRLGHDVEVGIEEDRGDLAAGHRTLVDVADEESLFEAAVREAHATVAVLDAALPLADIKGPVGPAHFPKSFTLVALVLASVDVAARPLEDPKALLLVAVVLALVGVALALLALAPLPKAVLESVVELSDVGAAIPPRVLAVPTRLPCSFSASLTEFVLANVRVPVREYVGSVAVLETALPLPLVTIA